MKWDSSRPVPWQRLFKESALYGAIVSILFIVLLRNQPVGSMISGVAMGMVFYLILGYSLAKLGIQRKTYAERKAEAAQKATASDDEASSSTQPRGPRPKPAPTRRTNAPADPRRSNRRRR